MIRKPLTALALAAATVAPMAALADGGDDPSLNPTSPYVRERITANGQVYYEPMQAPSPRDAWRYDPPTNKYYYEPLQPRRYDYYQDRDRSYYYNYNAPSYDPWFPQQGQRVERGLFNRRGPNDFGN